MTSGCNSSPIIAHFYLVVWFSLTSWVVCQGASNRLPSITTGSETSRVIGGFPAGLFESRHLAHVIISFSDSSFVNLCTSTVIAPRWLLFAAHCLVGPKFKYTATVKGSYAFVGERNPLLRLHNTKKAAFDIDAFYVHRLHKAGVIYDYRHDIAMIRLKLPIPPMMYQPIAMARISKDIPHFGSIVFAAGYGAVSAKGEKANVVMKTKLRLAPFNTCKDREHPYIRRFLGQNVMICAVSLGFPKVGRTDTCSGDSGGPLYIFDKRNGVMRQFGITSFGTSSCANPGAVTWYTRIDTHYGAIQQNLRGIRKQWRLIPQK